MATIGMSEETISLDDFSTIQGIFGVGDENLRILEEQFDVNIGLVSQGISIRGKRREVLLVKEFVNKLIELGKQDILLDSREIRDYIASNNLETQQSYKQDKNSYINVTLGKKHVVAKTKGQEDYIRVMRNYDVVFAIGPAGTGKTYLAVAWAVNCLLEKKVKRIILTRPAVEAGESLGFLPGGIGDKLGPYLRPLYDSLYDILEARVVDEYLATGVIEVVPLAYMRGRTLNGSFVILDEAQNCTADQIRMSLTRLGFNSRMVITGDITQSDLPGGKPLGLLEAINILKPLNDLKFIQLSRNDVVRHPLVQKIIKAYEDFYDKGNV